MIVVLSKQEVVLLCCTHATENALECVKNEGHESKTIVVLKTRLEKVFGIKNQIRKLDNDAMIGRSMVRPRTLHRITYFALETIDGIAFQSSLRVSRVYSIAFLPNTVT